MPPYSGQGPSDSTVLIRTEDGRMNFEFVTVGPMSIFCHGSDLDGAFQSAQIDVQGLTTTIPITPTKGMKNSQTRYYPGILLQLGRSNDGIQIKLSHHFRKSKSRHRNSPLVMAE
jgi:hypothetical protein